MLLLLYAQSLFKIISAEEFLTLCGFGQLINLTFWIIIKISVLFSLMGWAQLMVAPSVEPEGLGPSGLLKDAQARGHPFIGIIKTEGLLRGTKAEARKVVASDKFSR